MNVEDSALIRLLSAFVAGRDRSVKLAGEIEVALDETFGDEEPFASLALALASYQPGGGEFLYDEAQIIQMMNPVIEILRERSAVDVASRDRSSMFPMPLQRALATGSWTDPGPEALKRLLGLEQAESDLELFGSRQMMERVKADLDSHGYVDDPEFCMLRSSSDRVGPTDPRLVYRNAVFIGGSKFPGDDVFLAIDTSEPEQEQSVLWFDWTLAPPERWRPLLPLSVMLERLAELETENQGSPKAR